MPAQPKGFNYDESKVPAYILPDPLTAEDGSPIDTVEKWETKRRPEILSLFETHVYGRRPAVPLDQKSVVTEESSDALGGKAHRKQVTLLFEGGSQPYGLRLLIYLPKGSSTPAPLFLGYNFNGNHSIHSDRNIHLSPSWMRKNSNGNREHRATSASRGASSYRWPVEKIIAKGYGIATAYYGDVEPDHAEGWKRGIRSFYTKDERGDPLEIEDWSAISVWAWGLSRIADYLESDPLINASQVALLGHSRLGKTALWAGANDPRFSIVISNNSGCGGAALSRRAFGETVKRINANFPHWFCRQFSTYDDNESALPVDQHQLIALMAPRPTYIASAVEDKWADPKGEFLSAKNASPVYSLYGLQGVQASVQPGPNTPVGDFIGYHIRDGKHDVTLYDWEQYLEFADRHFARH
ncbi:MAG: acetylxylan esterase [Verrucomicrobiota bacterium]